MNPGNPRLIVPLIYLRVVLVQQHVHKGCTGYVLIETTALLQCKPRVPSPVRASITAVEKSASGSMSAFINSSNCPACVFLDCSSLLTDQVAAQEISFLRRKPHEFAHNLSARRLRHGRRGWRRRRRRRHASNQVPPRRQLPHPHRDRRPRRVSVRPRPSITAPSVYGCKLKKTGSS